MAKIRVLGILTVVAAFLATASLAHAGIIAYDVPAGEPGNQNFTGSLGLDFDVLAPVNVYSLGVFDASQDGISGTLHAQIYDRSGPGPATIDLAFTSGDPGTLVNGSRFKNLPSPVTLPVGSYSIVAYGFSDSDLNGNSGCVGNPGASCLGGNDFNLSALNDGGGLIAFTGFGRFATAAGGFPGLEVPAGPPIFFENTFHAGTFAYSPTPEPGTLLLIGSGLLGIGVGGRRRKRK